mmetsp:Transcript_12403/g.20446  ORF Transcript_12403/g.20446 Transcript_12403/m.20446 type:complete len:201 (-) Transcript_12403:9-611(-)
MKTADGKIWTAKGQDSISDTSIITKQAKPLKNTTEYIKSNDAETKTTSRKQPKPFKMRPTQLLVSKNESNPLGSWIRDIATISFPLFMLYILATHPLIKDVGQPHTRKMNSLELQKKALHEHNQKLNFLHAVAKYNFLTAMNGGQCCYTFPNSDFEPFKPDRSALFKNRYKKWKPQKGAVKGEKKVKGVVVNARKKMIPT